MKCKENTDVRPCVSADQHLTKGRDWRLDGVNTGRPIEAMSQLPGPTQEEGEGEVTLEIHARDRGDARRRAHNKVFQVTTAADPTQDAARQQMAKSESHLWVEIAPQRGAPFKWLQCQLKEHATLVVPTNISDWPFWARRQKPSTPIVYSIKVPVFNEIKALHSGYLNVVCLYGTPYKASAAIKIIKELVIGLKKSAQIIHQTRKSKSLPTVVNYPNEQNDRST